MKIAFVSYQFDGSGLMYHLARQGHSVYVWAEKYDCLRGVDGVQIYKKSQIKLETYIEKVRDEVDLIVFDGENYGFYQDYYRKVGLPVIGSSRFGEVIEEKRELQNKLAQKLGVRKPKFHIVEDIGEVINYIKRNRKRYILKQSGNLPKTFNYKAKLEDSEDLILHLLSLKRRFGDRYSGRFIIEEVVEGVEVATSAFWTPYGWLRTIDDEVLIEVNFEHKGLLDGDRGVTTGEMGTVAWFDQGENRIFREMLVPLEPFLQRFNNWGNVDANCIVTPEGDLYLLEWTIRFGYPITDLYCELVPDMARFLMAIYKGNVVEVNLYPIIGVVLVLAFPIFPYELVRNITDSYLYEYLIIPEDVSFYPGLVNYDKKRSLWYLSDNYGYAGTIAVKGRDLKSLIKRVVSKVESIVPSHRGFYRTDIGKRVLEALELDYVKDVVFPSKGTARHSIAMSDDLGLKELE